MRITSSGNVGIGVTSVSSNLSGSARVLGICDATNANLASLRLGSGTSFSSGSRMEVYSAAGTCGLYGQDNIPMLFSTNNAERMRIDSSGRFLIGKTTTGTSGDGYVFSPNGNCIITLSSPVSDTLNVWDGTSGVYRFYVTRGGTIFATSTSISAISDARLKENVRPLELGLSEVIALQPRRFDWKEGKGQDKKDAVGFIAQEFEQVLPNSVGTSKAGEDGIEYKNINYEELVPTLVKAIQELNAKVTALEAQINQ
jgi:hypothetical protein